MNQEQLFVTPSLKITGGNLEIVRLARELADRGIPVRLVAMWRSPHEVNTKGLPITYLSQTLISARMARFKMPLIIGRFRSMITPKQTVIASHYATYPLAWLAPRRRRWFFVQDTEWLFVQGWAGQVFLRHFIVGSLRRGRAISANRYLTGQLRDHGVNIATEATIWADPRYLNVTEQMREVDIAVMLRRGAHKRADLTLELLQDLKERLPDARVVAISPDETFQTSIPPDVQYFTRPTLEFMRKLYARTKIFALMSEHEGFGLPPLEAMGSGCVPFCRDAGGVHNYMRHELQGNVISRKASVSAMTDAIVSLLGNDEKLRNLSALARRLFHEGQLDCASRVERLLAAGFGE